MQHEYIKGRGAQLNPPNKFDKQRLTTNEDEIWEDVWPGDTRTEFFIEHPKKLINKVESPDLPMEYSMNPYQGCEHGCTYCYARVTHQYWGLSAGLDFESKIMVKANAIEVLKKELDNPKWKVAPIMLSGNTDCYQPAERKYRLTRGILETLLTYKHPVGIITKNSLILRDIDVLQELAKFDLVHVNISITTLDESLRQKMEPRTSTSMQRLKVIEKLSQLGIPVCVMAAPIVPGLNDSEIPQILKLAAEKGASSAGYGIVRLNGEIGEIFTDWIHKNYPDRAEKVLNQIAHCHGGKINDSRLGVRMRGEGAIADAIRDLFRLTKKKYFADKVYPPYNLDAFTRPQRGQLKLF